MRNINGAPRRRARDGQPDVRERVAALGTVLLVLGAVIVIWVSIVWAAIALVKLAL